MTAQAQLIPISQSTINNFQTLTVDGRELHAFLGVRRDYSTWIKGRIDKYGFSEGQDYILSSPDLVNMDIDSESAAGGFRKSIIYTLTLDMAKELSMVENNAKGRAVRRYFIECERRALEAHFASRPELPEARSTVKDRRPLVALINTWINTARLGYHDAWHQVFALFGVDRARDLAVSQIKPACEFVQARLDAAQSTGVATAPAAEPPAVVMVMDVLFDVKTRALENTNAINNLYQSLRDLDARAWEDYKTMDEAWTSLSNLRISRSLSALI